MSTLKCGASTFDAYSGLEAHRNTKLSICIPSKGKKIDDSTFCEKVKRGQFRIHPEGPLGISQGCVTFKKMSDFRTFSSIIKGSGKIKIPGTSIESYGKLTVL